MTIGQLIQEQILGMQWLNDIVGHTLINLSIDITTRWGASLHFFLYDTIKITLLLGILIFAISYIQTYFPPTRTRAILQRFHGIRANTIAALLGTITPFCSCSSIPIFIGFNSVGLPIGVAFSFLISSPMVDLASLVLLMSIFGWKIAVCYVLFGLIIAIIGGILIERLHLTDQIEDYIRSHAFYEATLPRLRIQERCRTAWHTARFTVKKVLPYILLGVGIGAFIHNWLPQTFIIHTLGTGNPWGVIVATFIGIPMYADIFGTIPIAEALLAKGAQLGVVLSFMMGVTTLSLPALVMLRKAIKPKLLAAFLTICTLGIITVGYLFNLLQPWLIN